MRPPPFMPDGRTVAYAVLGRPIGHTLSPRMHNAAFRALGWNAIYLAFDAGPDRVTEILGTLQAMGFGGANLTVPLKEAAFRGLARRAPSADRAGSVNTVQFTPGGPVGHSTDGEAFLRAAREAFGEGPEGRSVFVLGAGGAGGAVARAVAGAGAAELRLADRAAPRAATLARDLRARFPGCAVRATACERAGRDAADCDWIVQATPAGLRPEDPLPLLPDGGFRPGQAVYDLVYGRPDTPFTRAAREGGARAEAGLGMLLYQGVRSFEIWTGQTPPVEVMRRALGEQKEAAP